MYAIETKNLTKKYKDITAVDDLNLTVNKGELFALLGVNGAGKTTTIKMLSCLSAPTSGDALLLGQSVTKNSSEVKRIIGVSPQETAVAPNLTVKENLEFMCGIYGLTKEERECRMDAVAESLNLREIYDKKASKLSGGWQRRLSIALALIGQPEILFLDEPTLGLDVLARSELWDTIKSLKGDVTIILTTHYMEEADELSDRIGIMRSGKMLAIGTADELKKLSGKDKFEDAFVSIVKGETK